VKKLGTTATKRVTLADVAAKAGVSVATASVAITGRPSGNCRVSPPVAEKIRRAARTLNYRPNLQARNLSTQRTHTVAVLVKRAAWHNAMFYLSAAQHVLREHGYLEICTLYPDNRLESERAAIDLCIQRRVEGIIAIPLIDLEGKANAELFNQMHREERIPVVQLGLALPKCQAPAVVMDESEGILRAVRLLHAMGHTRIGHVTIAGYDNPEPLNPFLAAHLRYAGYRRAMAELGLAQQVFANEDRVTEIETLFDAAVRLSPRIAGASPRPTALIAFSDYTAAGLIAGLADAGVSVPADISILGVGEQTFDRMLRPALSTLSPPCEKMGELATQTLLKMIAGGEGESAALPPVLIMRDSVRELKHH
jgi:DNA-binding LacI/PurR family transcriptional regulator